MKKIYFPCKESSDGNKVYSTITLNGTIQIIGQGADDKGQYLLYSIMPKNDICSNNLSARWGGHESRW
jgi:hypothetical protein